jgi:hypothetical protein
LHFLKSEGLNHVYVVNLAAGSARVRVVDEPTLTVNDDGMPDAGVSGARNTCHVEPMNPFTAFTQIRPWF